MTRRVILSLTLIATVATAAMAAGPSTGVASQLGMSLSHTPLGRMATGCLGRLLTLRADLNVTDQQREQIRKLIMSHRAEIAETVKSVREARVALRDLARAGHTQQVEIQAAADALGQAVSKAAVGAVQLRSEISELLTEEQKGTIDKFLSENDASISEFLNSIAKRS